MRGTVPFMPPEQMLDFKTVLPSGDLYATAATLYYLLTGQFIYDEVAEGGDLIRMLEEPPVPIRKRRRRRPAGLGRRHREVPGPRSERPLSDRHRDAPGAPAVLLSRLGPPENAGHSPGISAAARVIGKMRFQI